MKMKKYRPIKIAGRIVIIVWLIMMGLLIKRSYFKPLPSILNPEIHGVVLEIKEEWMGVYFKGEKIGYSVSRIEKIERGYEFHEQVLMNLNVMGTPQRIFTALVSIVNSDLSLKSFIFNLTSGITRFIVSGEVKGKKIFLRTNSGGKSETTLLELKEVPYLTQHIKPFLLLHGLTVGKKYRQTFFDPFTLSNNEILLEVEGEEKFEVNGKEVTVYCVKESFKGFIVKSWVSENGETLKEESPLGFVLKKEPKEKAISGLSEGVGQDIITMSAVPTEKIINKNNPAYLKVRLKGIDLGSPGIKEFRFNEGRQILRGDILEIKSENLEQISSYLIPLRKPGLEEFLKPSILVQSDDPEIVTKAKEIIGNERDAKEVIRLLLRWMKVNLNKKPTLSIPSAREVLRTKTGDCNEHAVFFTALARSLGIPARICGGVVYSQGFFYYHAWTEVYLDKWISVDPIMNQFPADATHIKLVEGETEKQLPLLGLLGKLKIEVIAYQ